MNKRLIISTIFTLFLTQASFANMNVDGFSNKHCDAIADACKSANFTDEGKGDKSFWFGCMKPVLHDKTVDGVTVDAKDVKECRKAKIEKMKKEIKDLEAIK